MQLVRRVKTMQPSSIPMLSMSSAVASGPVLVDRSQAGHAPQHRHAGSGGAYLQSKSIRVATEADVVAITARASKKPCRPKLPSTRSALPFT